MTQGIPFREVQQFRQPWLLAVVGGVCLLEIGTFGSGVMQQIGKGKPWGNHPLPDLSLIMVFGFVVLTSLAIVVLFTLAKLVTEARWDGLYVRFIPFHLRFLKFPYEEIQSWEVVTYRPIPDYGGWGIRYGFAGKAFNVSGNRGVRLLFRDGKKLMIGSQRPEELAQAISQSKGHSPRPL